MLKRFVKKRNIIVVVKGKLMNIPVEPFKLITDRDPLPVIRGAKK